jgi:hypothetical protein
MLRLRRPLFGNFVGTMGQSDSLIRTSVACAHRLPTAAPHGADTGPPGSRAWCFHACSGSQRTTAPGPTAPRPLGAAGVAFGSGNRLGTWRSNPISRLNTRPACAPVNASGTSLRTCPHDSGSSWVASPSMCDFLLRYTMPVYPGASPGTDTEGWKGTRNRSPVDAFDSSDTGH